MNAPKKRAQIGGIRLTENDDGLIQQRRAIPIKQDHPVTTVTNNHRRHGTKTPAM